MSPTASTPDPSTPPEPAVLGADPVGPDPVATDRDAAAPAEAEPIAAEPTAAEPTAAEPTAAEPGEAEQQAQAAPAAEAEPSELVEAEQGGSEPAAAAPVEAQPEPPAPPREPDPAVIARLTEALPVARAAAVAAAELDLGAALGEQAVGEHLEAVGEDPDSVTHYFAATQGGYRGWRWSVTLSCGGPDTDVTVDEVVLLPGADALVAPVWVPWEHRVRPGDLGVGDLLPTIEGDERLVPAYLASDDPAVEEVAVEIGLGRARVLSREGRESAARRWQEGPHGPAADMARAAPGACGTCGFFLSIAGSLRAGFGVCGNEYGPADGSVVAVGFGCGAHSDVQVEPMSPVAVAELVYDDGVDLEPAGR